MDEANVQGMIENDLALVSPPGPFFPVMLWGPSKDRWGGGGNVPRRGSPR